MSAPKSGLRRGSGSGSERWHLPTGLVKPLLLSGPVLRSGGALEAARACGSVEPHYWGQGFSLELTAY